MPWDNRNGWLGVKHQMTYLLYVGGIAYVLRHAEIWIQGFNEGFNRWHKWYISVSDVNDRRQATVDRHSVWKYDHGFGFFVI